MNAGSEKKIEVDDLLRRALADDLPEGVAAGMRRRIAHFREMKTGDEAAGRGAAARAWISRRSVWAAISVLLLVAGILLQIGKSSSPLAERVAAIKAQYASLELPRR
jgi:hypothetical protein